MQKTAICLQTNDENFRELILLAENVAANKAPVLITGEAGVGKESLALRIHEKSSRANANFVVVDCSAGTENQVENEIFGSELSAFSKYQASCKAELADNGTLFLKEVGALSLSAQQKLFKLLQYGEIERNFGKKKVNIRIILSSVRSLSQLVQKQKFREDLYYKINVVPLHIPPLRMRKSDIMLLAKSILKAYCLVHAKENKVFSADAITAIESNAWTGNYKELESCIERAVLTQTGSLIDIQDLEIKQEVSSKISQLEPGMTLWEMEKQLINKTLEYTKQNRTQAAKLLGISIRTLRNKLNEYKIGERVDFIAGDFS